MVTLRPRFSSSAPIDAEARPLPSDETTPPVTKMNLVCFPRSRRFVCGIQHPLGPASYGSKARFAIGFGSRNCLEVRADGELEVQRHAGREVDVGNARAIGEGTAAGA